MAANHWVRKIKILNDSLQLSLVMFSDLATEDHGEFWAVPIVRLASSSLWPS